MTDCQIVLEVMVADCSTQLVQRRKTHVAKLRVVTALFNDLCSFLCPATMYRVVQKLHKVYGSIILQPYITESCGF